MKFTLRKAGLCFLGALSLTSALAIEQPDTTPWLQARGLDSIKWLPTEPVWCVDTQGNWVEIPADIVSASIAKAAELQDQNKRVDGKYPSPINKPKSLPGFPEGVDGNVMHYPIAQTMSGIAVYDGRNYGDMLRVMYQFKKGDKEATYVGVWTHEGAAKYNGFVWCGTASQRAHASG